MPGSKVIWVSKGVVFSNKAPLCKGGWRPQGDWGIVFMHKFLPKC